MILNPFDAIGNFFLGLIKEGHLQAWFRLLASCSATAFVTFWGGLGTSIWSLYSANYAWPWVLILAFANASILMAVSVLFLWRKSSLSKHLPIAIPGQIQRELDKVLEKESMILTGDPKKEGT